MIVVKGAVRCNKCLTQCCCCCREFPGQLTKILEWFRDYKIPDGKPANAFGYDNKCMDKAFTLKVGTWYLNGVITFA
jgi:hypothetical protein